MIKRLGDILRNVERDWRSYLEDRWNNEEPPDISGKNWKWLRLILNTNEKAIWNEDNLDEVLFDKKEMKGMADFEKEQISLQANRIKFQNYEIRATKI